MHIQIESPQFKADQKLIDRINRKLANLQRFFDRIEGVTVFLKLESSKSVREKVVEMQLQIPGDRIFYSQSGSTFEAAFDKGLDALKRQVKRMKQRRRKK